MTTHGSNKLLGMGFNEEGIVTDYGFLLNARAKAGDVRAILLLEMTINL